jgi:transcriptional regulator with PAS, ATPase and Fis domain
MSKTPPLVQSLIDVQDNPFVLIDDDYHIVAANRAYRLTYETGGQEVVGRHCYAVSHHRESPCHLHGEDCPHQQVFETGEMHQVIHTHYDHHGRPEQVRIKGHAVRAGQKLWLGEAILPLATQNDLNCDEMRMIGRSPAFLHAIEALTRAAESEASILLLGESGVGKELAAHYLHTHSARRHHPFLAVDCATISEPLFESEIFGHERGAFTGCVGRKQGLFELTDGGTLFLDEVAEIPLPIQAKLLRVLETGEFRRVGGREVLRADVRIVAATNRDLKEMVAEGRFREDLYYRLACVTIRLPALRERRSDIQALAEALLAHINQKSTRRPYLSGEALERLMNYDFPGNVRELRNILQRATALCRNEMIGVQELGLDVPPAVMAKGEVAVAKSEGEGEVAPQPLRNLELHYMRALLARYDGNRRQVAQTLGISERTLYRKLKRYGASGES